MSATKYFVLNDSERTFGLRRLEVDQDKKNPGQLRAGNGLWGPGRKKQAKGSLLQDSEGLALFLKSLFFYRVTVSKTGP